MRVFLVVFFILFACSVSFSQSPGGVSANLKFWVRADAGVTGTTNVSNWADQSGLGNNAVQAIAGKQPALVTADLNFNPTINFSGATTIMTLTSPPADLNSTIFTVGIPTNNASWRTMFRGNTNDHPVIIQSGGTTLGFFDNPGGGFQSSGFTWLQNEAALVGLEMRTGDVNFRKNGTQGVSITTINLTGVTLDNFGNYQGNGQNFGRIAETIIYNNGTALTTSEKQRIESYLAVKYGLSLAHDYLATDGSVTWNSVANSGYGNNITGIGRDDLSALDQRKSTNANANGGVTMDLGGPFGSDKNFIIWGDDAGTGTSSNIPGSYSLRSNRIWKTAVTGGSSTVSFSVDLSAIGLINTGTATDYAVLVDTDTDFSSGAAVNNTGATLAGNVLSFTGVSLTNNGFFTIAAANVKQPGGVVGLVFWVKADKGVTGTTNVNPWADQSGYNNAIQAVPGQQPSLVTNDINFNPSVNFSGSTTIMQITTPPADLNSTIFTVAVPTVNTNWRTMFRGSVNDHPMIIQSGGNGLGFYDNVSGSYKSSGFNWLQNEVALVGLEMRSGDVNFRKNGTQGASINTINLAGVSLNYFGNYQGSGQNFGRVAETLIYNTAAALTANDKSKIESYLAVKYGLTLVHDYLNSGGSVVWSATTNAGNASDLTGVGRDDLSALDQRKSKSVNAGTVLTLEKTTPGSAFGSDLGFLVAGDDAASLGATTTGAPSGFPAFPMRVTRVWRAQVSGAPGTVTISFDLGTGIYNSGIAANYSLLIGNSSDFSATTPITGGTIAGSVISFSGVTLGSGDYFTLGLPRVASPGGVIAGLKVWLKSNSGVSSDAAGAIPAVDLGAVQRWNDQSSLNNNATNTGSPIFNTTNNLINFNPTVFYDGSSGHNLTYSVSNQYSLITVSKMEGTLNRRAFSSRIGNVLAGFWNGREDVLHLDGNPSILGGATASTNPRLYSLTRASGGAYQFFRNGLNLNSGGASFNSTIQLGIANGGAFGTEASKMYVSEVVQYDRDLTAGELNKVHSYLAIKYGFTLDQTTPTNYVLSDGTVVWDATANATYSSGITGIGRDDAASQDQRKSRSINARSPLSFDKGGPFTSDKNFLIAGNDNSLLTPTKVNAHPSYPYRITRTWRAQSTGAPGAVSVSFDLGVGIYNTGNAADYALLIKNADNNFSAGATAYTAGASFSGSVLTFTGVNFTNGDYFTLGMPNVPGPGGVVSNLQLWLKANQGVTGAGTASAWNDQSGNGFNVSQATAGNQPSIQTNRVNFNPSIQFNGANTNLSLTGGFLGTNAYANANVFVISRNNGISNSSVFFETTSTGQFNGHMPWGDNALYWDAGNTGTNRLAVAWGGSLNTPYLWSLAASTTAMPSGALQEIYRNGRRIANDLTMSSFTGNNSNLFIGSGNGGNYYNGEVSEMVVYSGNLTTIQLQQIQSYLALKYGITMSQTVPQDYLSSVGSPIYHTLTTHAGYGNDVAGIGRDDNAALDQRKSKSINTSPADILSIANVDFTAPSAFGADLQYLVWGHNGLSLSSDVTMGPYTHDGAVITRQLSRIWSTDKLGAQTGNAIIEVDMSVINGPTGPGTNSTADVRLLIDNDAVFGNASGGEHAYSVSGSSGGKVYFTVPYADFAMGQGFVSLGSVNAVTAPLFSPAPGGIAADVRLWLNASAGVSGAGVATWTDQSPYAFSAAQANASKQPTLLTNRVNFNPSVSFDGSNDELTITNGILKDGTYNDVYVYGIHRTNVIQSEKIFAETNLAGNQFGVYTPWSDNNVYWDAGDSGGSNRIVVNWGGVVNVPYLWSFAGSTTATPSGAKEDIYRNGLRLANDNNMSSFTGNGANMSVGSQLGSNFYNGEISELLIITSALTASQHQRLQSYFALKYGITLNQNTPADYFASNNSVIFHTSSTHALYKNDIAGIGRDDNSVLDQRKSKSINSPADIITMANGNFTTPTAFGGDLQFLVWGHNGLPYAADAGISVFTHNGVNLKKRLGRIWSTDLKGGPAGSVVVEFNMNLIGGPTGAGTNSNADLRVLIDNDATFGNSSAGEVTLSPDAGFAASGGTIYFTIPYGSITPGQGFITLGSVNAITCPLAGALPGGVSAPMKIWLKANAGVTGVANASAWADQSGNGYSALQATVANQPTILNNRLNFNTSLQFNGANSNMLVAGGILGTSSYTDLNVFLVSRANTVSNAQSFQENAAAGGQLAGFTPWGDNNIYWDAGNSGANRLNFNWGGAVNIPYVWTLAASTTATASGALEDIYRNGLRIANDNTMNTFSGTNGNLFVGSGNGANFYNGEISEFVVYNATLTSAQQQRVQSYLGIKYGLTLDQTIATNYLASDASVIWNATTNATHKSDIAGIGRDDASGLDQRKSQSANARSIVQMDNGNIAFANDKNFVIWGSDNGLTGPTATGAFPGFAYRVGRTWKVALTGTPGAVNVSFDLSQGIYNSGNAADYQLVFKAGDTNFATGATGVSGSLVGSMLTFSGVNLVDGNYFTLAQNNIPAPGGVLANLQFWVKANSGVTGVANASAWSDQSGNGFIAAQAVAGNQPAIQNSRLNFNPALQFNGTTHQMVVSGGIVGTATYNDFHFFGVARTNVVQAGSLFFETQAAGGRINVHLPWTDNLTYWDAGSAGGTQRLSVAWGGAVNTNYVWSYTASTTATPSGARQDIYRNGRRIANDNTMSSFTGNNSNFTIGNGTGAWNGEMAELVYYKGPLTLAQLQCIQGYLAIKYGITLDQTAAQDYVASDWNGVTGSKVWNAAAAGSYKTDITAIGRDDKSGLNQKQSGSANTGNTLSISNGTGALAVDNATNANNFVTNYSFLSWSHNNLPMSGLGVLDFGNSTNGDAIKTRLARVWFAQETGTVGTVHLRFDLSAVLGVGGIAGNNDLSKLRLLVDANGVFAAGAFSIAPIAFNNGTGIVEFETDFIPATGFYFSIGSIDLTSAPLPVELVSFDATTADDFVALNWVTASELNNDYFLVESSTDAESWSEVVRVHGKGTTSQRNTYAAMDPSPYLGKSYYRLTQVDFDGTRKFSDVKRVEFMGVLKLYPNPTSGKMVTLVLPTTQSGVWISISNILGQQVYSKYMSDLEKRNQTFQLDLADLPTGEYLVKIINGSEIHYRQLIVE